MRIALCLLACVALASVVPGCAGKEASSVPAGAAVPADASLPATARQVLTWLPGDKPVAGWKRTKAPQVFGPDNLWEFIDGAAETYLTFGFQELVSVSCT